MPQPLLLISVKDVREALEALAGGADIIDIKDPARGSLGMANERDIVEIVEAVQGRAPISLALGELKDLQALPRLQGVAWAKVGLSGMHAESIFPAWIDLAHRIRPARLIAVHYADFRRAEAPGFEAVLQLARALPPPPPGPATAGGLLIDTAIKDGKGLLHWYDVETLKSFHRQCRQANLFLALAGSLTAATVSELLESVRPEILAVRGAACSSADRLACVEGAHVRALKALLAGDSSAGNPEPSARIEETRHRQRPAVHTLPPTVFAPRSCKP